MESYFGGKNGNGTLQTILSMIPEHKYYVEGFTGSGAIIRNKKKCLCDIGFELDRAVIDKYHYRSSYTILNYSFLEFISKVNPLYLLDTFIYLDPPYLNSTRQSSKRYVFEMSVQNHIDLINCVISLKCKIMISGYNSALYSSMLEGWNTKTFLSMTRGGMREETIWMNYDCSKDIYNYDYLGVNYTDRQRIKRKVLRIVSKINSLPILERKCILSAIIVDSKKW